MTNFQASCGHVIEHGEEKRIAIKALTREWNPCIHYISACPTCYSRYAANGDILHTDGEQQRYLNDE